MIDPIRSFPAPLPSPTSPGDTPADLGDFSADLAAALQRRIPRSPREAKPASDAVPTSGAPGEVPTNDQSVEETVPGSPIGSSDAEPDQSDPATIGETVSTGAACSCCNGASLMTMAPAAPPAPAPAPQVAAPATDATATVGAATLPATDAFGVDTSASAPSAPPAIASAPAMPAAVPTPDTAAAGTGVSVEPSADPLIESATVVVGPSAASDGPATDDDHPDTAVGAVAQQAAAASTVVAMPAPTTAPITTPATGGSGTGAVSGAVTSITPPDGSTSPETTADSDDSNGDTPSSGTTPDPGAIKGADTGAPREVVVNAPAPAPSVATAGPSTPAPATNAGVMRSEQVRILRELAPNRQVQRLAVDLDGSRVALRFDADGARVNVLADPGGRLGGSWADDVQRTLNAGARPQNGQQHRDPDGGRRNRHPYESARAFDERETAEFAARFESAQGA